MKLFTTILTLFSIVFLANAANESEKFQLQSIHSGTELQYQSLAVEDDKLVINGKVDSSISYITSEGKLAVGDHYVVVGPNSELALTSDVNKGQAGFSIKEGKVLYSSDFYAVKVDNKFDLYIGSVSAKNAIGFSIRALKKDGSVAADFSPSPVSTSSSTSSASATSSVVSSSPAPAPAPSAIPIAEGDSVPFLPIAIKSGSEFQFTAIVEEKGKLIIKSKQDSQQSHITKDGKFVIGAYYVYIGPNSEVALTTDVSKAQTGFGIKDTHVTFSKEFYAVKDGDAYSLFFTQTVGAVGILVKTGEINGKSVPDFPAAPSTSSSASATSSSAPSPSQTSIPVEEGDSKPFHLLVIRSGTDIHNKAVAFEDGYLVINGKDSPAGHVTKDGYLAIGPYYVTLGPQSKIALITDKSKAESGFSIKGGFVVHATLNYWANNYGTSKYTLYFGQSDDSNSIPFSLWAIDENGKSVPDFPASSTTTTLPPAPTTPASSKSSPAPTKPAPTPSPTPSPSPKTPTSSVPPAPPSSKASIFTNIAASQSVGLGSALLAMVALLF